MGSNDTLIHDAFLNYQSVMSAVVCDLRVVVRVSVRLRALLADTVQCVLLPLPLIQSSPSHCRGLFIPIRLAG